MKLYEVLLEDKKQVQEAPMGMLNTLGNKAMSKLGSDRATGKLSTGALANQLHKEFQTYLGKTGREATKDAVMGFLSSKGYPTQGAATIINQALKGAGAAPSGPLANMKATAQGLAGKAKDAMVKQAGNIADKLKPGLKAAPIDKTEPTMGDETPTTTGPADTTAAAPEPTKTSGSFNNQLAGGKQTINRSTGFDRNTMQNTSEPMDPKAIGSVPNTTNPTTAPKQLDPRDLNKNGEVDATEKSIARNKGKKKTATVSASKINTGNMVAEAGPGVLPQSIVDKAILKAAQEAEIMNTKQGKTSARQAGVGGITPTTATPSADATGNSSAGAADAGSTSGGFGSGLKKGFAGKAKATPDLAGLEQRIAAIEKKVGLA